MDAPAEGAPRRAHNARTNGRGPSAVRVSLLGAFALSEDGISREIPRAARRLIALLALNRRGLSRTRAATQLTPHLEEASATGSLRATLARLRATGLPVLEVDANTLRLAPDVTVDAWELEELAARVALSSEESPGRVRLDDFALELLPDWDDDWVLFERARLQDLFLHALEAHGASAGERGQPPPCPRYGL